MFETVAELLSRGPLDFAIVAVPTASHVTVAEELAEAGVSMLIEKPLAATSEAARRIVEICRRRGRIRLRRSRRAVQPCASGAAPAAPRWPDRPAVHRLDDRSGPFPARVQDVGVVKDLATHDIDLVSWLCDSQIATVAAQTQHLSGREHEDLVLAVGALRVRRRVQCRRRLGLARRRSGGRACSASAACSRPTP